ncbi:hypothetical protein GAPWKB11_0524 [Gilliamella apicola]|nr:hypothetical protein GAPWKB11_0524 [Gilliamella apicola]
MKLFANQGDIAVQAQNANLNMAAKQEVKVDSVDGKVALSANKKITLICGGSYIKISEEGIELGTQDNVYFKCNVMQKMGGQTQETESELPVGCQRTLSQQTKTQGALVEL